MRSKAKTPRRERRRLLHAHPSVSPRFALDWLRHSGHARRSRVVCSSLGAAYRCEAWETLNSPHSFGSRTRQKQNVFRSLKNRRLKETSSVNQHNTGTASHGFQRQKTPQVLTLERFSVNQNQIGINIETINSVCVQRLLQIRAVAFWIKPAKIDRTFFTRQYYWAGLRGTTVRTEPYRSVPGSCWNISKGITHVWSAESKPNKTVSKAFGLFSVAYKSPPLAFRWNSNT